MDAFSRSWAAKAAGELEAALVSPEWSDEQVRELSDQLRKAEVVADVPRWQEAADGG